MQHLAEHAKVQAHRPGGSAYEAMPFSQEHCLEKLFSMAINSSPLLHSTLANSSDDADHVSSLLILEAEAQKKLQNQIRHLHAMQEGGDPLQLQRFQQYVRSKARRRALADEGRAQAVANPGTRTRPVLIPVPTLTMSNGTLSSCAVLSPYPVEAMQPRAGAVRPCAGQPPSSPIVLSPNHSPVSFVNLGAKCRPVTYPRAEPQQPAGNPASAHAISRRLVQSEGAV